MERVKEMCTKEAISVLSERGFMKVKEMEWIIKKEAGGEAMGVQIHSQLTQHFSTNGFPHSQSLSITSPCFISLKPLSASETMLFI